MLIFSGKWSVPLLIGSLFIWTDLVFGNVTAHPLKTSHACTKIVIKVITCPFDLFAASAGFSAAVSSFAPFLEICAPMLSHATKNRSQMNEQRALASPSDASRAHSQERLFSNKTAEKRLREVKLWSTDRENPLIIARSQIKYIILG